EGVLRITTELAGKTGLPSASLLVVAPIPREAPSDGQKSPTAKLHLVGRINPSAVSNDPTRFLRAGPSRVLQIGDKRYHEAGASRDDRIAFRFALPDAGHLYVAMVAYPDNMSRSAGIVMSTPRLPTSYDVATGHLSGDEPPTLRMQSHPIYFWPRERQGAFIFRTLEDGRPAAVANVDLFRVRGGLGASMTDTPPDGGRRIGLHWEAPAVPTQFGCLGSHPVQVYRSFHRLTDYLRFTGQNLLVYPILGVRGPLMASEYERFSGGPAIYAHCQGWLDMVLALCERRSLRFLPELLFHDSLTLRTRAGSQSEAAILAGAPTARMALWDDSISLTVPASTPLYSPSHPAFQEALLTLLDEFLTRYAKSPALEGAALRLGQRQSGWFGSIQCGYGDATIDQFEKDTKIAVPVDPASPSRFSLRARWLLTHQYDAWVRWRCTVVAALHAKLADRLHQARPGLKLILTVASPSHVTSQPLFGATSLSAERPVAQLLREAGIDLAAYAASPNIVVRHVLHPVDDAYLRYRYPDSGPLHRDGFVRDVNYLEEFTQPFRSPHGTAVAAMFRPFTPVSGALRPPKGLWWRPFGKRMTQPTQAGRAFLEPYAHALAALDTPMLSAGHSTLVTLGHEPHLHLFARAFKALPNRPFTDIHGLSDPVCGRQLQTQDSHTVYFVNRTAWPVDLAVAFTGKDVRLLDLATLDPVSLPAAKDKSLPAPMPRKFVSEHTLPAEPGPMPKLDARENVSGPLLQRQLLAYELAAYRVLGAKTEIAYATARCPEKVRHALAQRVASARQMLANAKAPPAALDAAKHTLALAERAYQKHELRRAQLLLDSNPLNQLR
ncbi:hypothetical protein HQ560_06915, partial [bacterium]|nr:hypothetical protein [bacterium]